jgi:hypothetical protein
MKKLGGVELHKKRLVYMELPKILNIKTRGYIENFGLALEISSKFDREIFKFNVSHLGRNYEVEIKGTELDENDERVILIEAKEV